jgi:hypothetical protein
MPGGGSSENDAIAGALVAEGRPLIVIDLDDVYDLGAEFCRWELAVAVAGHVLGINPFDEPNVQESKDNTSRVLKQFESAGMLDVDGIDAQAAPVALSGGSTTIDADVTAALRTAFTACRPGDYVAIMAYVAPDDAVEEAFAEMRVWIRDALGVATTLGYGPRFLHSTGQLHKGGPQSGIFVQVTATETADIAVPGRPFTFGQLKRAQAIGDFEALQARGRPLVRVHLGADVAAGMAALCEAMRRATDLAEVAGR